MSTSQIREKLHDYIDSADDRFLNIIYAMVQADLENFSIHKEHKDILDDRLADHEKNPTQGSSWDDVKNRIRKSL